MSPAYPAFSLLSRPLPPARARRALFPAGRGDFSFLMQGASPLASPRPSRKRHGLNLRDKYPEGACPLGRLPPLPVACFLAPIPPTPFPAGRGDFSFLMQGAPPLASPRLSRKRHGLNLRGKYPEGACPLGRLLTLPLVCFSAPFPEGEG